MRDVSYEELCIVGLGVVILLILLGNKALLWLGWI